MNESICLVMGATSDIAQETIKKLTNPKWTVLGAGHNDVLLDHLQKNNNIKTYKTDATDMEQVDLLFSEIINEFGRIDAVINCVGSIFLKPAHLTTEKEWQNTLNTNLGSAFSVVKAAGKHMVNGGSVVLLSTAASLIGVPNHEAIAAAKGGINSLVLSAAATYAHRNLRFNAIAPGLVATKATEKITHNSTALAASIANHPLGRIGRPDEVANLITWLVDPNNSWITAQVIAVDGGLSALRNRNKI